MYFINYIINIIYMKKGFLLKKKSKKKTVKKKAAATTKGMANLKVSATEKARVIFIPEAHENFQMKLEIGKMLIEEIPRFMEKGITKISLVSE